jgi:O-antigen/teichoic acid export membrane protein
LLFIKNIFVKFSSQKIKTRFAVSFIGNISKLTLSFVAGLIIARGLGPKEYGDFSFLLTSFLSFRQLLDMGTSQAFYTFISERKQSSLFYIYYALWMLFQFVLTIAFIWFICPKHLFEELWLGHAKELVILAFVASFTMTQLWEIITSIGESLRDTLYVQIRNLALAITYLLVISLLFYFEHIGIKQLYILIIIIYFFFSILYYLKIKKDLFDNTTSFSSALMFTEFKVFCKPLVVYSWVGFVYTFADNWILQKYGGSVQQGYYAIGLRFSVLSLIATTSILKIFWKEIAEANGENNESRIKYLYNKTTIILYFSAAALSSFIIPFAKEIPSWLLGSDYQNAWIPLTLMFIYPLYQSLGQISGAFFLATKRSRLYKNLGLIIMFIGFPFTYFLIANKEALIPGLGMGAIGLSIKMLVLVIIEINIKMFYISRVLVIPFKWFFQIYILLILIVLGLFSKYSIGIILSISGLNKVPIVWFGLSGIVYLGLIILMIMIIPGLIGLTKKELNRIMSSLLKIITK